MNGKILKKFLNGKYVKKGNKPTHSRIGNKKLNITGGSYTIDYNDSTIKNNFIKKYNLEVFKKMGSEYLTELQDKENGNPILIDLDFKFDKTDFKERKLNEEIIFDIVESYVEKINNYFNLSKIKSFDIYVLLKDDFKVESEYIKDGIHIQINLIMKHDKQLFLRNKVMKSIYDEVFSDLNIQNNIEDIFDKSISSGDTGWLMYGSKKPGGEPYKLKYKYEAILDNENDIELIDKDIKKEKNVDLIKKLLIRNSNYEEIEIKEGFKKECSSNNRKRVNNNIGNSTNTIQGTSIIANSFKNIKTEKDCDLTIELLLEENRLHSEKFKEINTYLMECLGEDHYNPHHEWIRVMWALKNTDYLLYPFFLKWSAQSNKFSWDDYEENFKRWNSGKQNEKNKLTEGSIRYWSKMANPEKYLEIRNNSTNYYIEKTLEGKGTDNDIAKLIHHLLYDKYRCTSIRGNIWYSFINHKWVSSESGTGIRRKLSSMISPLYIQKQTEIMEKIRADDNMTPDTQERLTTEAAIYNKISMRLKETSQKNNVMIESKELHYDSRLESLLDENPYLVCFKNGVYDFTDGGCFRDGIPEDYISKSTNIDYVKLDNENTEHIRIQKEIKEFMAKLFPNENLREYIWQHLASCLLGTNQNQTFNIYTGVGSNGKSVFVKLFSMVLGDYKGTVPISLITQKRLSIGGTSSEVAQLKGLRYAVMNEPSKNDKINEGIMKEITGGDPIQARELFKTSITFTPMFKLTCCTNSLFDITANDEGTWRRIRVVDFESKFIDNPSKDPKDKEFKKDKTLEKKFNEWAPILASMLIEIVNKTKGEVTDCKEVMASSKKYREQQDYLARFVSEKIKSIVFDPNKPDKKIKKLSKSDAVSEFKEWWKREYDTKVPKAQELVEYLNLRLGTFNRGWKGFEIIHDDYDSDNE
jgi:P4 family phage/plasmid primase-like protien